MINRIKAAQLKLQLLSEGLQFSNRFLIQFSKDSLYMEKRKVYNNPDEKYDRGIKKIPQELLINDIIIAVNFKRRSPWILDYEEACGYVLKKEDKVITTVTFPRRPHFLSAHMKNGMECGYVANLYGGMDLAFFTPATCYYNASDSGCLYCSLKSNRKNGDDYATWITEEMVEEVTGIALDLDRDIVKGVMLVGGNMQNENENFLNLLKLTDAIERIQVSQMGEVIWETHIATMPPTDCSLFEFAKSYNLRITMNMEVFDDKLFSQYCPGKFTLYGRDKLKNAIKTAAAIIDYGKVHSILIAGLEPVESTIEGIHFLAENGICPIINVFHNDFGTPLQNHKRPSSDELLKIGKELQTIYLKYGFVPYWDGCGRNSLDYEAKEALFV